MDISILRHSCSHIMAQAVKELYPDVKVAIGPSIEDGFYYDFDKKEPFTPEDLEKIEEKMRQIIKKNLDFKRELWDKPKAIEFFKKSGETYKLALIDGITDEQVSIYQTGNAFTDLCKGPHVRATGEIAAFKLLSIAGAYWRGDEHNPMLQRIYGTCFDSKDALKDYLRKREEAQKRDHRKLGVELGLFEMSPEMGAGLVLYHPKGALVRTIIEDYEKREHRKRGYQMVIGPHIMKSDIWVRSGHYDYYKENMYIFTIDNQEYAVKPMNCPGHILVYKSRIRSYKELPLRFFELGTVYRQEKSGVLHGLLRVRGFTQDDAHLFCTEDNLKSEIKGIIDFVIDTMKAFGFEEWEIELSTRPQKSIGTDIDWERATAALTDSLKEKGLAFDINEGDGAFYGPKIDIKLKDALGRSWQCATIQCDFALPERFDLAFVAADGAHRRPIMLHRVLLGSLERFMGALIEHYAGAFPVWLSPVQAQIIPVTDNQHEYAQKMKEALEKEDIRAEADLRGEKVGYKIREAVMQKVPYLIVVGEKEVTENALSVRYERGPDKGKVSSGVSLTEFINTIKKQIMERK
ncbi:MAG: threonine--tRNA ligase [Candidatus Omnitrophica bacterium]|nr:threonine--tRNA ligase [Candidatus Omnitrophota bacterium]MBU4477564.1 threonine--tRNA ligase [Candidatus Omnitrophota bacterium]MCG2703592.1 threonine--tRNA ligase [Candidatus Omnitrophota bacterium]